MTHHSEIATSSSVMVRYDYATALPAPLGEAFVAAIERHEGIGLKSEAAPA